MKLALAQLDVVPGRPDRNVAAGLEMIAEAKRQKADIVALPELFVSGYLLGDNKWNADEACLDYMSYNEPLLEASHGIAIIYGNVFLDTNINERVQTRAWYPNRDGRTRKYNAAYVIQNGKPAARAKETKLLPSGIQPKTLQPTYRIFDDDRHFFSLIQISQQFNTPLETLLQPWLIDVNGGQKKVGVIICEDGWWNEYGVNPAGILIKNSAEAVVDLSASPFTLGKNAARDRRVISTKEDVESRGLQFPPFYYVNCCGVQNNGKNLIMFDGDTTAYNKQAKPVVLSSGMYKPELLIVSHDAVCNAPAIERKEKSLIEQKRDTLVRGWRAFLDMVGVSGNPRVWHGLSGGIDSTVGALLIAEAFGSGCLECIGMPTRFNSKGTQGIAAQFAQQCGFTYHVVPIQEIATLQERMLLSVNPKVRVSPLARGNIAARIRGAGVLAGLAGVYGGIFSNNGNKDEMWLGYATIHGDLSGAGAHLGDMTKMEVVALAKLYKHEYQEKYGFDPIPDSLIPDELWTERADFVFPTAELEEEQKDPIKFGYHCSLLQHMLGYYRKTPADIMELYLNGTLDTTLDAYHVGVADNPQGLTARLMQRYSLFEPKNFIADLKWFASAFERNVFKRTEFTPLIFMTSKTTFGFDNRECILPPYETKRQRALEREIREGMRVYCPKGRGAA